MAATEFSSGYGLCQKNENQGIAILENINFQEML